MIIMNIIFIILLNLIIALSLQWWILWSSWASPPQYQHLTMNLIILIIMQKLLLLILYITLRVTGIIYNYHDHDYPCAHQSNQNPHDHPNHPNHHHHLLNSILGLLGTTDGLVGPVVLFCLILFYDCWFLLYCFHIVAFDIMKFYHCKYMFQKISIFWLKPYLLRIPGPLTLWRIWQHWISEPGVSGSVGQSGVINSWSIEMQEL